MVALEKKLKTQKGVVVLKHCGTLKLKKIL
jgi:hypothetical protein